MNKKRMAKIVNQLVNIREMIEVLTSLKDEEEDYLYNIPENLQGSERYDIAENAVDCLDSALSNLEEAADSLDDMTE